MKLKKWKKNPSGGSQEKENLEALTVKFSVTSMHCFILIADLLSGHSGDGQCKRKLAK